MRAFQSYEVSLKKKRKKNAVYHEQLFRTTTYILFDKLL